MSDTAYGPLEIVQLEVGLLQNFCEVIGCPSTGEAALVDPAFEVDRLLAVARAKGWRVTTILLTHTHDDHVAGLDEAFAETGAVIRCHPSEVAIAEGFAPGNPGLDAARSNVQAVADGEDVVIGRGRMRSIWAPGHTPGCICWYGPESEALITGDVLFVGGCGGVSYEGSDPAAMVDTLQRKLGSLPEQTRVYPGHDYGKTPTSSLMWEFANNPALLADTLAKFCAFKRVPVPG